MQSMNYRPTRPNRPWYSYSSRNNRGRKQDPIVYKRRNLILDLYWQKREIKEIAEAADVAEHTVWDYIRRARKLGDPRAGPRSGHQQSERRLLLAELRRREIVDMRRQGLSAHVIAKRLGCNISLVRKRLREAEQAKSVSTAELVEDTE